MTIGKRKRLAVDYQRTFGSPEGKRVLADLRKHCPLLMESISLAGGVDVNKLLVLEGQRSVLLYIYKKLRLDPNEETAGHVTNELTGG